MKTTKLQEKLKSMDYPCKIIGMQDYEKAGDLEFSMIISNTEPKASIVTECHQAEHIITVDLIATRYEEDGAKNDTFAYKVRYCIMPKRNENLEPFKQ
ncbi:MAG: hypothetical protein PHG06_23920 [Parabacteroides sp.]|nr:hypothetical protein [Parabacteroides sp.]